MENLKPCRCLEEGAEDFIVKPVKLSDVKRLKGYMTTTREVKVGSHDRGSGVVDDVGVEIEINNKRKLVEEEEEETSDMSSSSSPPSVSTLSSSPSVSSPSSSPTSSPIRRLKMSSSSSSSSDWLSVMAASTAVFIFLVLRCIGFGFLSPGSKNCNYPLLVSVTVFVALALSYLLLICFVCLLYEGGLTLWKKHNHDVIEIKYYCNVLAEGAMKKRKKKRMGGVSEDWKWCETDGIIVCKILSGVKNKEMWNGDVGSVPLRKRVGRCGGVLELLYLSGCLWWRRFGCNKPAISESIASVMWKRNQNIWLLILDHTHPHVPFFSSFSNLFSTLFPHSVAFKISYEIKVTDLMCQP